MQRLFVGLAALLVFSNSSFAQSESENESESIFSITAIGSGCPDGLLSSHWEGSTLVLDFADLTAEKGEGLSLAESRAACNVTLDLKIPAPLRYGVYGYSVVGTQDIGEEDLNTVSLSAFFQGQGLTASHSAAVEADAGERFRVRHAFQADERVWSPCGEHRSLTVTASVRLSGADRLSPAVSTIKRLRLPLLLGICPRD